MTVQGIVSIGKAFIRSNPNVGIILYLLRDSDVRCKEKAPTYHKLIIASMLNFSALRFRGISLTIKCRIERSCNVDWASVRLVVTHRGFAKFGVNRAVVLNTNFAGGGTDNVTPRKSVDFVIVTRP